jgi:hypothetical protein
MALSGKNHQRRTCGTGIADRALVRDLFPPIIPPYEEESDAKEDGIMFDRGAGIHADGGVVGIGPR